MSEEKDYRISYLLQNFKDETFTIDRIDGGNIVFIAASGKELNIKCGLPKKITSIENGTVIEVTKKRFSMKDAPKSLDLGENRAKGMGVAMPPDSTPLGEGPSNDQ